MKVGFAKKDISPKHPCRMEGLRQTELSQDVHDPLYIRSMSIEDDKNRYLIIAFDLLFLSRKYIELLKNSLTKKLNLPSSHILINFSHTHAGPHCSNWNYGGEPDANMVNSWIDSAMITAIDSFSNTETVRMYSGMTETTLPLSRRRLNENGIAEWGPSVDGEVCKALPLCLFKNEKGDIITGLISASCHPSIIYSPNISAEYPGAVVRRLNEYFDTSGFIFLQGAAGDSKPKTTAVFKNNGHCFFRNGSWNDLESAATLIVKPAIELIENGLEEQSDLDLNATYKEIQWPLTSAPSAEELIGIIQNDSSNKKKWAQEMLNTLNANEKLCEHLNVGVQIFQFSKELRLIAIEGEIVAGIGNKILDIFRDGVTFPLGYSNGVQAYLITNGMAKEKGYEVDSYWEYGLASPLCDRGVMQIYKYLEEESH